MTSAGSLGEDFTLADVVQLGKALGNLITQKEGPKIVMGRDGR